MADDLGTVCAFLAGDEFRGRPNPDYDVQQIDGAQVLARWNESALGPKPDAAALDMARADLTSINGLKYSQWKDEIRLLRERAKEKLDEIESFEALLRALALVVLDEINILREEFSFTPRTATQLRSAIKAKIDAGEADA